MATPTDPVITIYNLIKNNLTETNPPAASINYQSAPIETRMTEPPIIAVFRPKSEPEARYVRAPWRTTFTNLTIGSVPQYLPVQPVQISVALKSNSTTGEDIFTAMQQKWNLINDIVTIIASNAYNPSASIGFIEMDSYWDDDDYTTTPPLVTANIIVRCILSQVQG